jgi:hypothetical protein
VTRDVRTLNTTTTVDPAAKIGGSVSSLMPISSRPPRSAPVVVLFVLGLAS